MGLKNIIIIINIARTKIVKRKEKNISRSIISRKEKITNLSIKYSLRNVETTKVMERIKYLDGSLGRLA
jgi:hypothetical protein